MSANEHSGVLLLDKPLGPTCRRLLDDLERRLKLGPLGHAGTLDPLATGLVVVLVGRMRRFQNDFTGKDKVYEAEVCFGQVSETCDAEGPLAEGAEPVPDGLEDAVRAALPQFLGAVEQVPPKHSAIHIQGRRAHRWARAGKEVEIPSRTVRIDRIDLQGVEQDRVRLEIACGAGTYIRSLARDLGEALGCGAYLSGLRRTRSGEMDVATAVAPAEIQAEQLVPIESVLAHFARLEVTADEILPLSIGQPVELGARAWPAGDGPVYAWSEGALVCRLKRLSGDRIRSEMLLRPR